ncbi:MAG: hypothetical protein H0X64_00040 [Gemmatimonadaceae bacterium]|nr:hypothetical protein [Gemmatimonadaceae bacterium]
MKALFVFEYGGEYMMDDLMQGVRRAVPGLQTRLCHGLVGGYVAGGTQPVRILNAAYMYATLPFVMMRWRPAVVLVRTTPPGIQLWAALLGRLMNIRVGCWMMDYHPELEARVLDRRRGAGWVARLIRGIDRYLLRRMSFVIVLDDAMQALVRSRAPAVPIVQHPTWGAVADVTHEDAVDSGNASRGELCLAYGGNLGFAHPLETFETLIREIQLSTRVRIVAIGASSRGERRFAGLAERTGAVLTILPRHPFAGLGKLFAEHRVDAGVVLLSDETSGVVAPSKFSAYLRFGLPTLYIGPARTSSQALAARFDAGFALANGAAPADVRAAAARLVDPAELSRTRANTRGAAEFFGSRSGTTLAAAISKFFAG